MPVEPLFDDLDVGDLDGASLDDYRAWKRAHTRADPFPNGESLDEASRDPDSPHHDIANATPYLFGEERLAKAATRLVGHRRERDA